MGLARSLYTPPHWLVRVAISPANCVYLNSLTAPPHGLMPIISIFVESSDIFLVKGAVDLGGIAVFLTKMRNAQRYET